MSDFTQSNAASFARIQAKLDLLRAPDATPLMVSWMDVIRTDNREGILAGTDKDGLPLAPVTYRPVQPGEPVRTGNQARGWIRSRTRLTWIAWKAHPRLVT